VKEKGKGENLSTSTEGEKAGVGRRVEEKQTEAQTLCLRKKRKPAEKERTMKKEHYCKVLGKRAWWGKIR